MSIINGLSHENWISREKVAVLPNGAEVSYIEAGNTDKMPLLLLHGFCGSSRTWKMCTDVLKEDYHIFAINLMGVRQSSSPSQFAYSITEQAEAILGMMNVVGLDKAYVAGHSIGSMIAQAMAFISPDKVTKLILISSFVRMKETPEDIKTAFERYNNPNFSPSEKWFSERDKYPDQEGFKYQMKDISNLRKGYFASSWWGMTMTDNRNFLQFISAPSLVIWGASDMALGKEYRDELIEYLPNAKYLTYENFGHEIVSTNPKRLCEDIRNFLG